MKSKSLFYIALATIVLTVSSCGGNSSSPENEGAAKDPKVKELTPDEIGAAVGNLYVQAMTEIAEMVQNDPSSEELEPQLIELKEKYVQQLVEFGYKREAMEQADKSKMDLAMRLSLNDAYDNQVYTTYSEAVNDYFDDNEVRELLASFNIITQYSNFELLKQQEPDEAQRLGIE